MINREKEKKWSFTPSTFVLIIACAVIVGYAGGTRNDQVVEFVAPKLGFKVATGTLDFDSVQQTYRTLKANFDGDLNEKDLISGANRGLVAAAGDDYTVYLDRKEAEEFNKDLAGDIGGGIGAEIGGRDFKPTVIRTLEGTPASKSGLRSGDTIVAVNDIPTAGLSLDDVVSMIRGEIGTTVKITVLRGLKTEKYSITRAKITAPSVESEVKDGIGILTLKRFDDTTADKARDAANMFKSKNVRGVVLDLRGNGGGLLESAVDISSLWLNKKVVVEERAGNKTMDKLYSNNNPILEGVPTVVLVNESSASASEIVAGALQDHGVATLIGQKTFGKGSVQQLIDMPGGAVLKVTIAKWYTPNGKNINKDGITPKIKVDMDQSDYNSNRDPQLERAVKHLKK